jgi:pantothenate kinase
MEQISFAQALAKTHELLSNSGSRVILGIAGKPGAGKSQLSSYLVENLPAELVALVPMDGFHMSNEELIELGRRDRKGAPDTFDVDGYVKLLEKIRTSKSEIRFPIFHREIEGSIADEGLITPATQLVITEGNYLLHDQDGWERVAPLLDHRWYIGVDDSVRLERLVARHHRYGKELEAAHNWAHGSDENNAKVVEASKSRADLIVINE